MEYTVKETSEICKVSEETVRRWLRTGKLKAFKYGRDWRITKEALENLRKGE